MILETHYHNQRGTHDAASLLEWLQECSWLPISVDRIKKDMDNQENPEREEYLFLPHSHDVYFDGEVRVARSSMERQSPFRFFGRAEIERRWGFKLLRLWCLNDVVAHIHHLLGLKCHFCHGVFAMPLGENDFLHDAYNQYWSVLAHRFGMEIPIPYENRNRAICPLCKDDAHEAMKTASPKALKKLQCVSSERSEARRAVKQLWSYPRLTNSMKYDLTVISRVLGLDKSDIKIPERKQQPKMDPTR